MKFENHTFWINKFNADLLIIKNNILLLILFFCLNAKKIKGNDKILNNNTKDKIANHVDGNNMYIECNKNWVILNILI